MHRHVLPERKDRILVVEDDCDSAELLRFVLEPRFEVTVAAGFDEALASLRLHPFDGYLLDELLPDHSGTEFCRRVREVDPHVPVIFCSAASLQHESEAMRSGAHAFFRKPVDLTRVLRTLEQLVKDAAVRSCNAAAGAEDLLCNQIAGELGTTEGADLRASHPQRPTFPRSPLREPSLLAKGCLAFLAAGGTLAHFEELWPEILRFLL